MVKSLEYMSMVERPGVFKRLFTLFVSSLRSRYDKIVVGKDQFGNIYYEERPLQKDWAKAVNRGYIPGSKINWRNIPIEWESWLQNRRDAIPTQEEIDYNNQQILLVKEKALRLEEKARMDTLIHKETEQYERSDASSHVPMTHSLRLKSGSISKKNSLGEKSSFPKLEEYEVFPGQKDIEIERSRR